MHCGRANGRSSFPASLLYQSLVLFRATQPPLTHHILPPLLVSLVARFGPLPLDPVPRPEAHLRSEQSRDGRQEAL